MPSQFDPKIPVNVKLVEQNALSIEKILASQEKFEESLKTVTAGNPEFLSMTLSPGHPNHDGNTVVNPQHGTKLQGTDDGIFVSVPHLGACAVVFQDKAGFHNLRLDGDGAFISLRDGAGKHETVRLDGAGGAIQLKNDAGKPTIVLSRDGQIFLSDPKGQTIQIDGPGGVINLLNEAGDTTIVIDRHGHIFMGDGKGNQTIDIDGLKGDITLRNADFAEDFDVAEGEEIEPGTVMIIDSASKLRASDRAYDKRVAGVISGAGNFKPGIVLDKQHSMSRRLPVALVGKVYCKADAHYAPIEVGDLLTTSMSRGQAMKATDRSEAFGSIIGKALGTLHHGQGLIPILIALQ